MADPTAIDFMINFSSGYPVLAKFAIRVSGWAGIIFCSMSLWKALCRFGTGTLSEDKAPTWFILGLMLLGGMSLSAGYLLDNVMDSLFARGVGDITNRLADTASLSLAAGANGQEALQKFVYVTLQVFGICLIPFAFITGYNALKPNSDTSLWGTVVRFVVAGCFILPKETANVFWGFGDQIFNLV